VPDTYTYTHTDAKPNNAHTDTLSHTHRHSNANPCHTDAFTYSNTYTHVYAGRAGSQSIDADAG
jgi:hypothetical protein